MPQSVIWTDIGYGARENVRTAVEKTALYRLIWEVTFQQYRGSIIIFIYFKLILQIIKLYKSATNTLVTNSTMDRRKGKSTGIVTNVFFRVGGMSSSGAVCPLVLPTNTERNVRRPIDKKWHMQLNSTEWYLGSSPFGPDAPRP